MSRCVRLLLPVLLVAAAPACADDESIDPGNPFGECGISMPLSGGVNEDVFSTIEGGCAGSGALRNASVAFGQQEDQVITVRLSEISPGQVRLDVPATVSIVRNSDGREWTTDPGACTVDLLDNRLIMTDAEANTYLFEGRGTCSPAEPAILRFGETGPPITIGDFMFRGQVVWLK